MTSEEYRKELSKLSEMQRKALNEHIYKGNQPTIDQMAYTFESYPEEVEPKAVFWLRQNAPGFENKTEADRVAEATIRSAELTERSLTVSHKSLRAAYWALAIAVLALLVSIIALWK